MKRLLLNFGAGYTALLRAINVLGARNHLSVFQRCDYCVTPGVSFIGHVEPFPFKCPQNHLASLDNRNFDELYVLLTPDAHKNNHIQEFARQLRVPSCAFMYGNAPPLPTAELALKHGIGGWVETQPATRPPRSSRHIPLYAIVGVYNEVDIVYANVKHAFAQGCERVFLVDNGSQDGTVAEALSAGAELALSYETSQYVELVRIRLMNDLVESISLDSGEEAIWWLWLDADEFVEGPGGTTIANCLADLPTEFRIVGSGLVNHFPTSQPYYERRHHPGDFMPYGETYDTTTLKVKHCAVAHWKHPLQKFVRTAPPIRALSGFHVAACQTKLHEPSVSLVTHHFPFRDKEYTLQKYARLCGVNRNEINRMSFDDSISVGGASCNRRRYDNLLNIYNGLWDKVSINPGENPTPGVKLAKHMTAGTTWPLS